jgi:hypothetical protein
VAAEYAERDRWTVRPLTLDAYVAQHTGLRTRDAVGTVGVHLLGLAGVIGRGLTLERAKRVRSAARDRLTGGFTWLEPPQAPAHLTIEHLSEPEGGHRSPDEYEARARDWATAVWDSWAPHHDTIDRWIDWLVAASPPDLAEALPRSRRPHGAS